MKAAIVLYTSLYSSNYYHLGIINEVVLTVIIGLNAV